MTYGKNVDDSLGRLKMIFKVPSHAARDRQQSNPEQVLVEFACKLKRATGGKFKYELAEPRVLPYTQWFCRTNRWKEMVDEMRNNYLPLPSSTSISGPFTAKISLH